MDTYQPTHETPTQNTHTRQRLETARSRAAARAAADNELLAEMAESLASVGLSIDNLTDAQRIQALAGYTAVRQIEEIPELQPGQVGGYIRAVNRAMLQGSVTPNVGKILLYGAQLFLAAEPASDSAEISTARAICQQIDAVSNDKRHNRSKAK